MKKLRKLLKVSTVALSAALISLTATSCKSKADLSHTIVFYHTMGQTLTPTLDIAVANFQKDFPEWKVQHSQVGGYDDVKKKCNTTLQAKTQPSLAYCYPDHVAQYMTTRKVIDLSQLINSTDKVTKVSGEEVLVGYTAEEWADFTEVYLEDGKATNFIGASNYGYSDTAILTVPYVRSTEVLYYNKDLLTELKIAVPETWDDLWKACAKIKKAHPDMTPLGYDSDGNWFITMCKQNGWPYTPADDPTSIYKFNTPEAQDWLGQLKTYRELGYFETQTTYKTYTSGLFKKGVDGGAAFCVGSSGGASNQSSSAFNWGIAALPGSKKADGSIDKSAISQGPSLVFFDQDGDNSNLSEKEIMAWVFAKYILDVDYQCAFSQVSGYNPVRKSCFDEDYSDATSSYLEWLNGDSITGTAARMAKTMGNDLFVSPAFNGSANARTQVGNALVAVIEGEKSPVQALQDAVRNCGA